jgi:hypothetical protein
MSIHNYTLEYAGWSVEVELDCTHEGEREVRATHHDPGCPATGPEFDITAVTVNGSVHSVPVPVTFIDDMGLEDAVLQLLIAGLEQQAEDDAGERWAQDRRDQQEALDHAE